MKKPNHRRNHLLQRKRERKRLKRLKSKSKYKGLLSVYERVQLHQIDIDKKVVSNFKSNIYNYLEDEGFITGSEKNNTKITIPKSFNLCENYGQTVKIIRDIVYSMKHNMGEEIEINFSKCQNVDQSALFLLQITRLELQDDFSDLDKRMKVLSSKIKFKVVQSSNPKVNLHLLLCGYLPGANLKDGIVPIDTIGFVKGSKSQKHYFENKKGIIGTRIVNYLNRCLFDNGHSLTATGKNELGNMIGEILNNAEDHSPLNTWYVTANYYQDKDSKGSEKKSQVGVLNLSFLNFGYSIYEGLEQTKDENIEVYSYLDDAFNTLEKGSFTKENLFTLYALQDGVSRLKFEDNSRGTGTMTFINCFYSIGDYENKDRLISPQLSVLSGKTQLFCTNKYRPQQQSNGDFLLSLNKENDLTLPPDKKNLHSLRQKFPGTILSVRFCLNNEHMKDKFEISNERK